MGGFEFHRVKGIGPNRHLCRDSLGDRAASRHQVYCPAEIPSPCSGGEQTLGVKGPHRLGDLPLKGKTRDVVTELVQGLCSEGLRIADIHLN